MTLILTIITYLSAILRVKAPKTYTYLRFIIYCYLDIWWYFYLAILPMEHRTKCHWNGGNWCFNAFIMLVLVTIQWHFLLLLWNANFLSIVFFYIVYYSNTYHTYVQWHKSEFSFVCKSKRAWEITRSISNSHYSNKIPCIHHKQRIFCVQTLIIYES